MSEDPHPDEDRYDEDPEDADAPRENPGLDLGGGRYAHDITPASYAHQLFDPSEVPDLEIPQNILDQYDPDDQPPPGDPNYHAKMPRVPILITIFGCSACGSEIRLQFPLPERRNMLRFAFRLHDRECRARRSRPPTEQDEP